MNKCKKCGRFVGEREEFCKQHNIPVYKLGKSCQKISQNKKSKENNYRKQTINKGCFNCKHSDFVFVEFRYKQVKAYRCKVRNRSIDYYGICDLYTIRGS